MKVNELLEDRYFNQWAKDKAAENRARNKLLAPPKASKAAPAKAPKKEKPNFGKIWLDVQDAIGDSFPDGDPIDHIRGPKDQWGHLDMQLIDKVVKMYAGSKKAKYGLYDYLADMWDDHQADRLHDAAEMLKKKDFRLFDDNYGENFFHIKNAPSLHPFQPISKDWDDWDKVEVVPLSNPWR